MLSDSSARKLQPKAAAYRVYDEAGAPGFGIQITPSGAKSWFLRFQWRGKRRFLTLGHFPHTGTAAAREKAKAALSKLEAGEDPTAPPLAALGTLEALLSAWLAHRLDLGGRNLADIERMIRANCAPLLARPAAELTASDFRAALAAVHKRGARTLANRLRSHLHSMIRYGLQHDHDPRTLHQAVRFGLTANPLAAIPRDAAADKPGERVLSWAEVREVWHSERLPWRSRQACRLLVVLGARVNEVVQAPRSEFDLGGGLWTLPPDRAKNKREHVLPLPRLALDLLAELWALEDGDWLFPHRNTRNAAKPWGKTALSHAVRKACYDWEPRDLRRTWKTLTGEIGIEKGIRDRIQNHAQTDVSARHYDRYAYIAEKRAALDAWTEELAARMAGENVIPMRRKA